MEMKMIQQCLVPGMEHREETDLSAQACMAKLNERFADGFKEMREKRVGCSRVLCGLVLLLLCSFPSYLIRSSVCA